MQATMSCHGVEAKSQQSVRGVSVAVPEKFKFPKSHAPTPLNPKPYTQKQALPRRRDLRTAVASSHAEASRDQRPAIQPGLGGSKAFLGGA